MVGSVKLGRALFASDCQACHADAGKGGVPNPGSADGTVPPLNPIDPTLSNPDPQIFAENIDRFIQHGSVPQGPSPKLDMQPFGDSHTLTQQEIANIEAYVLSLNGVDRAALLHPGMKPKHFLLVLLVGIGVVGLLMGGLWLRYRRATADVTA